MIEFIQKKRSLSKSVDRYGDLPIETVIRTDERYNRPGLFQGPRGWDYWNLLQNPQAYQNPNLWPDKRPSYMIGQLKLPAGSVMTIRSKFPFARYFKFAVYRYANNTMVALKGGDLAGWEIEPDEGSDNPYRVGADRLTVNRNFTINVIAEDAPENLSGNIKNTIYTGSDENEIVFAIRIYVSDEGYDGLGLGFGNTPSANAAPYIYQVKLADGTVLSADDVDKQLANPLENPPPLVTQDQWYALVNSKDNDPELEPSTAPARKLSRWEIFRGVQYSIVGSFMKPEDRAKIKLQTEMEAGGDPTTVYLFSFLSRKFGPVYVFKAKMPTFPDTYAGAKTMSEGQVVYWSVATAASAPSGVLWDGVFDMMVPVDKNGYYTVVVSRPEDRPANATKENGIVWVDWGPGEGLEDPRNREDWGMILMRFMVCQPNWVNSPAKSDKPGTEQEIMGEYYPQGYYTTKKEFEAKKLK